MIKFFRHLRQKSLTSNKVLSYFLYAIGEIFLVVIGILIALQINNWNEEQKIQIKEIVNLEGLRSEILTSLEELKSDSSQHAEFYEATKKVHDFIHTKPALADSMYKTFYYASRYVYFFPTTSAYETLKSGNLEVIKSDSLRDMITDLYETGYRRILMKENTNRNANNVLSPYYKKHFRTKIFPENGDFTLNSIRYKISIPNDYNFIINDPEFESLISDAIHGRWVILYDFAQTISKAESCIEAIDAYLKDKK